MVARWIEATDLWKDRARSLKLRLRDRFRVAVDRHQHLPMFPDGYFSSTVQRWTHRFRNFRRETLPSSTTFYRKRVSEDVDADEDSVLTRMLQAVAVPVIGNVCHVFMHGLNRVQIYGAEKLHEALLCRPAKKPLITVSNHVASMDDPLVIASLVPPGVMFDSKNPRWTLCATDRCFRNPVTSAFFKYVKVLPVSRGDGIYQKGMDMAIAKLNRGQWVHIFPEGSRSRDGGKTMGSSKRGVGRLILDADVVPIVVPFVHTGMQDVMPIGAKIPRIGKMVTVLVGDPINFEDLLVAEENQGMSRGKLYDDVAARIGDRLQKLKAQVDRLAIEESQKLQKYPWRCTERASGILQQVDWESLGMESYVGNENNTSTTRPNLVAGPEKESDGPVQHPREIHSSGCSFSIGLSYEGGIVSRIRGYMDPTELMGFAARGLFVNCRLKDTSSAAVEGVGTSRAWNNLCQLIHRNHNVSASRMFVDAYN